MLQLLDALRTDGIPVQKLGLSLQGWIKDASKEVHATDPDHMADLLLLEDTRAFFLKAYGVEHSKWEPDYDELEQEEATLEEENPDEDE